MDKSKINGNSSKSAKQLGRSKDMSSEAYDNYFSEYPSDKRRAIYRAKKAIELIGDRRGKTLSIGVGNFGEAETIKKSGFDLEICDISSLAVDVAAKNGYKAFQADITKALPRKSYDLIFCLEVLEHLTDSLKALNNLKEALNPGGRLLVSLPNEFNLYRRLAILIGKPGIGGHAYHHLRFFDLKSAKKLISEANLDIIAVKHAPLMPLRWRLLLPLGELLKLIRPQLFGLSSIWLLKRPGEK